MPRRHRCSGSPVCVCSPSMFSSNRAFAQSPQRRVWDSGPTSSECLLQTRHRLYVSFGISYRRTLRGQSVIEKSGGDTYPLQNLSQEV
jgi:hypothetical protein